MNTVKQQHFPCPLCRTDIRLPAGGVDNFQCNFYIQEFSELTKQVSIPKEGTKRKNDDLPGGDTEKPKMKNEMTKADLICPSHTYTKEMVVSFCKRCNVPICWRCKVHEHSGHEWENLSVVVGESQLQLRSLDSRVRRFQKLLGELGEDRRQYMDHFTSEISTVIVDIKSCAEDIKDQVDSRCDALLGLLDHLKVTEISKVESHETQVETCLRDLAEVKQGLEHMLKGTGVLDLLASKSHLQEKADDTIRGIPGFIEKCKVVYDRKVSEGLTGKIESAMGYLSVERDQDEDQVEREPTADSPMDTDTAIPPTSSTWLRDPVVNATVPASNIRLLKKNSFKPRANNAGIKFIVSVPNFGTVIGYDSSPRYVDIVDDVGNRLRKYEAVHNTTCALLLGHSNLVICTANPRQVSQRRLPQFTPISYRTTDLPITATGIAVRNPGELLICGKEKAGIGTGIYRYCLETQDILPIYVNCDLHILKAPCDVVVTQDDDEEVYVVSDSKRKSVFFFSTDGRLLNTFPTHRCSFCPDGMCRDMNGNIVVADKGNNSVIVLSPRGVFLQELTRINNPRAVTFDMSGRLWVGEAEGTITIYDYIM